MGAGSARRAGPPLEPELARVVELVERDAGTCDAVATASGVSPGDAAVALARLELLGYVRTDAAGRYERTTLIAPQGAEDEAA